MRVEFTIDGIWDLRVHKPSEDGERAVNYTVYGENYIMPKLKNTVLDLINDK